MVENVVVEGFDRQWQCSGNNRERRYPVTTTTTTTTTTTATTTTSIATTHTTTAMTTTTMKATTSVGVVATDDNDDMESDEAGCWQQKLAEPGSRSGVYTFPSTSTRQLCDMHTEGGGWTVGSQ